MTIDQNHVDLLNLIGGNLKRVASTNGGTYHGPCPICGGKDRFTVQPQAENGGRWACRHCHPKWGDALAWVAHRDGLRLDTKEGFRIAADAIGLQLPETNRNPQYPPQRKIQTHHSEVIQPIDTLRRDYPAMSGMWQQYASTFVANCEQALWDENNDKVLSYLNKRGVTDYIAATAHIGYNPSPYRSDWHGVAVFVPRAIVLPWHVDGSLWGIRYRPPTGGYKWVSGSVGKMLFGSDELSPGCNVVLVESELCQLTIKSHSECILQDWNIVPVATGGTTGARALKWIVRLSLAARVLVAFDNDQPGHEAATWWTNCLENAARLVPTEKDPGDMFTAGASISQWLQSAFSISGRKN